jgi:hypothetical protein
MRGARFFGIIAIMPRAATCGLPNISRASSYFKSSPANCRASNRRTANFSSSVVRQADWVLFNLARPRLTFSRISQAEAVQTNGLGLALCAVR